MSTDTIVVGFDGSEQSHQALELASELAMKFDTEIHLLHVIDWTPYEFHTWEENEEQSKSRKEQIYHDRLELFPPIINKLKEQGITAASEVRFGHPAEVLAKSAEVKQAKMIVIGRRGLSKMRRMLFGSVASGVVHEAHCPVVIVP